MAQKPPRVSIGKLKLTDFRSYRELSVSFDGGAVVLTGENGAGKTNLLEAISLLTPGRGLRRAAYADAVREGAGGGFAVHASIDGPDGAVEIGTGAGGPPNGESEGGRKVRINGAPARSADEMLEWLRVMWLTPAMDGLFTGPASDRRRFLDRLVLTIDPAHGQRALDYEKAMRGRNRLLADNQRDETWFAAIEAQMAETGAAIAAARVEMVRLLAAMVEKTPEDGAFPRADLAIEGYLEGILAERPAVEAEESFRERLERERERDRSAGRTLDGPHRSDLIVRHRPKAMPAALSSTGEQKALLVGIVLSHARLTGELAGMAPILLLDEIAAHFDHLRRAALFDILDDLNGQVFMTGTEADLFAAIDNRAQFLTVADGAVRATG
ncbi:DNA replication/repair protein RecF [Nitratireductor mangrovi]|uniref:DNA replication/repair protein RecF n=1 Tax=Nitratireductor mangrovi TaxID=2599600 RepID=UPI0011B16AC9|nr:DNA replication/repair protein RecF [Nitratireductor mangrovi]